MIKKSNKQMGNFNTQSSLNKKKSSKRLNSAALTKKTPIKIVQSRKSCQIYITSLKTKQLQVWDKYELTCEREFLNPDDKDKRKKMLIWLLRDVRPVFRLGLRTVQHAIKMLDLYHCNQVNNRKEDSKAPMQTQRMSQNRLSKRLKFRNNNSLKPYINDSSNIGSIVVEQNKQLKSKPTQSKKINKSEKIDYQDQDTNTKMNSDINETDIVYPLNLQQLILDFVTCLFLAMKYNQIYPPQLNQLLNIIDVKVQAQKILQNELTILYAFNFNINMALVSDWYKILKDQFMPTWAAFAYLQYAMDVKSSTIAKDLIMFIQTNQSKYGNVACFSTLTTKLAINQITFEIYDTFIKFKKTKLNSIQNSSIERLTK